MRLRSQALLLLGIALCLGLTSACVKVDVSTTSADTNRFFKPPFPDIKPPIPIETLRARHAGGTVCPTSFSQNINGEKQQTAAWCWAASTRIVMEHHNKKELKPTNLQCNIVNKIFLGRLGGANCCQIRGTSEFIDVPTNDFIDAPLKCALGGWPHWVFEAYQFDYETVDTVLDWPALAREICSKGPFIHVIEGKGGGRHAYVVIGYSPAAPAQATNRSPSQPYVRIYDPTPTTIEENFSEGDYSAIPFDEYLGDWPANENGHHGYFHYRDYVQISPKSKDQQ